jgi:hypothetical protein
LLPAQTPIDDVHALVPEALSEQGEGFEITAASGTAAVPEEARCASLAAACMRPRSARAPAPNMPMSTAVLALLDGIRRVAETRRQSRRSISELPPHLFCEPVPEQSRSDIRRVAGRRPAN